MSLMTVIAKILCLLFTYSILAQVATSDFVLEINVLHQHWPIDTDRGDCDFDFSSEESHNEIICVQRDYGDHVCLIGEVTTSQSSHVILGRDAWPGLITLKDMMISNNSTEFEIVGCATKNILYGVHITTEIVVIQFRVTCLANFYGTHCSKYCTFTDSSEGHYYCDGHGNKRCLQGWMDPLSNCTTAICRKGCNLQPGAGSCSQPGECKCGSWWRGDLCNQCVPKRGCSANGYCKAPSECICQPGYIGDNCDINATICDEISTMKLSRDQCINMPNCSANVFDECSNQSSCIPNPCNEGLCNEIGEGRYECQCLAGWAGDHCEHNIDDCLSSPCMNNGTCIDLINGYFCQCTSEWSGENCSVSYYKCYEDTCKNGATCVELSYGFECVCTDGFTGGTCEMDRDECRNPNICSGRGFCVNLFGNYSCNCTDEYWGRNCEMDGNMCRSSPCLNGGTCISQDNNYTCLCPQGTTGGNCQLITTPCTPASCINGTCQGNETCECAPGFTGRTCNKTDDNGVTSQASNGVGTVVAVLIAGWLVAALFFILLLILIVVTAFLVRRAKNRLKNEQANDDSSSAVRTSVPNMSRSASLSNTLRYVDSESEVARLVQGSQGESVEFDNPLYSDYQPYRTLVGSSQVLN